MKRAILALLVTMMGCSSSADDLIGTWAMERADGCLYAVTFGELVEVDLVCELTDGTIGEMVALGEWEADEDTITTHTTHSSCANEHPETEKVRYSVDGDILRIITDEGVIALERLAEGGSSGAAIYGCYDSSGRFTAHPVSEL